ncbi:MAG: biotin/lipoyl-containing protein, partial [Rhodopila sp.]
MDTDVRNMADTEVKVPDIGDFKDVPIIEIHVEEGQSINADDPIITLESDKATMDVPSPASGTVEKLLVKVGDKVSEGYPVLRLRGNEEGSMRQPTSLLPQQEPPPAAQPTSAPPAPTSAPPGAPPQLGAAMGAVGTAINKGADISQVHASPSIRRVARELGVDLTQVKGTGEKGRITKEDVLGFLRGP